jgi:hypothetical protein
MTTEHLVLFVDQRPFEPLILYLADGGERYIPHREAVNIAEHALAIFLTYSTMQVEVIDTALIVGIKTVHPTDPALWTR